MSESMYREENNNISYIEHVKKTIKKMHCLTSARNTMMNLEESPAAPVADTTVVFSRHHG